MAAITCPVLFVLGAQDQMTPPKAAQSLIATARETGKSVQVVSLSVGHHQMTETPDATLFAVTFCAPRQPARLPGLDRQHRTGHGQQQLLGHAAHDELAHGGALADPDDQQGG